MIETTTTMRSVARGAAGGRNDKLGLRDRGAPGGTSAGLLRPGSGAIAQSAGGVMIAAVAASGALAEAARRVAAGAAAAAGMAASDGVAVSAGGATTAVLHSSSMDVMAVAAEARRPPGGAMTLTAPTALPL
jgi:hypothetical protein